MADYYKWFHDKLGDTIVAVLDEFRFWTEVIAEFMEWDETSAQRIANVYKEEIREQIREAEDIAKVVQQQMKDENEKEMNEFLAEEELKK